MRTKPLVFIFLFLFTNFLSAQETTSGIAFVNALPQKEPIDILYKGTPIRPFSFQSGDISLGFQVPSGTLPVQLSGYGDEKIDLQLELPAGSSFTAILTEKIEEDSKTQIQTKSPFSILVPTIPMANGQSSFIFVNATSKRPLEISANGKILNIDPLKFAPPIFSNQSLTFLIKPDQEQQMITLEEPGSFVVVIFQDEAGNLLSTLSGE